MYNPSSYYRPKTIEEAVSLLAQPHMTGALVSGGALQVPRAVAQVEAVIDVQGIPGLADITPARDDRLCIGAAASLDDVLRAPAVPSLLRDALRRVVPWNRRNMLSVAELIAYPAELPELLAVLLALDATLVFAMPEEYRVDLADLEMDAAQPRLPHQGLMTCVELTLPGPWHCWGMAHVARTPADPAILSAVTLLAVNEQGGVAEARIALSGAWKEPARLATGAAAALQGVNTLDETVLGRMLAALDDEIAPVGSFRGSTDYRRAMAPVLVRRALAACRSRFDS